MSIPNAPSQNANRANGLYHTFHMLVGRYVKVTHGRRGNKTWGVHTCCSYVSGRSSLAALAPSGRDYSRKQEEPLQGRRRLGRSARERHEQEGKRGSKVREGNTACQWLRLGHVLRSWRHNDALTGRGSTPRAAADKLRRRLRLLLSAERTQYLPHHVPFSRCCKEGQRQGGAAG